MTQFDMLLIAGGFATGSTYYVDHYPGDQRNTRIVVTVTLDQSYTIPMIVDTGAPWCVLDPELAVVLGLVPLATYTPSTELTVRGISYRGNLVRATLALRASVGADLAIEATLFVPALDSGEVWPWPNFLGLDGFLNRIRFAVDTAENVFYFGAQ